jgi:methionine synthase II (cobalamin-independent)
MSERPMATPPPSVREGGVFRGRRDMGVRTTVVGSYPKPPVEGETFVLRKTLHAAERGEAAPEDVVRAVQDLTREVIAEQERAGIDLVTDGQIGWDDLLTPFARHMAVSRPAD